MAQLISVFKQRIRLVNGGIEVEAVMVWDAQLRMLQPYALPNDMSKWAIDHNIMAREKKFDERIVRDDVHRPICFMVTMPSGAYDEVDEVFRLTEVGGLELYPLPNDWDWELADGGGSIFDRELWVIERKAHDFDPEPMFVTATYEDALQYWQDHCTCENDDFYRMRKVSA